MKRQPCPPMRGGPPLNNIAGRRFGHWLVIERAPNNAGRRTAWYCVCDCGKEKIVASCHLMSGASTNCGCSKPKGSAINTYNGGSRSHPLYQTWCGVVQRCCNSNCPQYRDYGGRGITICPEWRNDFWAFVAALGPKPSPCHQIDRIDNNRGYEPGNCRWATSAEQALNTRRNRFVVYRGAKMPLISAVRLAAIPYSRAKWRLDHGASDDEALR